MDFQTGPVRELDQAFEKLRPRSGVLRPVVQIDRQTPHFRKLTSHARPPGSQTVAPEVTCFVMTKQQRQCSGDQDQNAKGNQFFFRRRIMIPAFGDFAVAVGSCFSPPMRIRPN